VRLLLKSVNVVLELLSYEPIYARMRYKGLGQSLKVRIANSCLPAELNLLLDKSSHLRCLAHQ